ncbi:hypothetical protein R3P38DRAFT_2786804 [Favolaschia claudopus]|uniref:Uncharacterized protein n=1 Tax=Favolaschia claudopus TaxID=2862362 RepID=A0AAW0APN6_9AGAR
MPPTKRKAQRAGLKQGRYGHSKVPKAGKENFTVYLANATVESETDYSEEPGANFSSLPIHGTLSEPTALGNFDGSEERRPNSPAMPPLRPASPFPDDDIVLPNLEPVSDDETGEEEEDLADDEEDEEDEEDEDDDYGEGDWDDQLYEEARKRMPGYRPATASAPKPPAATQPAQDMHHTQNNSSGTHSPGSGPPFPPSNPFANPWADSHTPLSNASPPADSWRFNFSADDEYYEEYESDDLRDRDNDAPGPNEREPPSNPSTTQPDGDSCGGEFTAPSKETARAALKAINNLLRPPRNKGAGYKKCKLHLYTRTRLEWMASFLHLYTSDKTAPTGQLSVHSKWISASLTAAHAAQKGPWLARKLREWTRAFMKDSDDIPMSPYGSWNRERCILEDADVANEIAMHLQSLGKYVRALDIVHYIDRPEIKTRLKLKKGIHLATAQRWMKSMGYRWTKNPSGQYVDGHERADVVYYRQTEFIPAFTELEYQTRKWVLENKELVMKLPPEHLFKRLFNTPIMCFHPESRGLN